MIFPIQQRERRAIHWHARAPGGRGQPVEWRTELFKVVRRPLPALWADSVHSPVFLLPWRAPGIQLPGRAARDSHSEENPAAAIQKLLLRVTSLHVHTGT